MTNEGINRWFLGDIVSSSRGIVDQVVQILFLAQCVDCYLEWYFTVLHPHIIPHIEHGDDVRPSDAWGPFDNVPSPLDGVDNQQRLQIIVVIVENLMSLINQDG